MLYPTGWKPKFPDLEAIAETAWAWHKNHPNGYNVDGGG